MRRVFALFLGLPGVWACDESGAGGPQPRASTIAVGSVSAVATASAPPALPEPARVHVNGAVTGAGEVAFTVGGAYHARDGLEVVLGEVPPACPGSGTDTAVITFTVPPGPGGRFFEGGTIALPLRLTEPTKNMVPAHGVLARIERAPTAATPRLEGTLRVVNTLSDGTLGQPPGKMELQGTFSVPVCNAPVGAQALAPDAAPAAKPLAGIAVRGARVGQAWWEIFLFARPEDASCKSWRELSGRAFHVLSDLGALDVGGLTASGPQPARVLWHEAQALPDRDSYSPSGSAAIDWAGHDPEASTWTGKVWSSTSSGPSGAFTVDVCR